MSLAKRVKNAYRHCEGYILYRNRLFVALYTLLKSPLLTDYSLQKI